MKHKNALTRVRKYFPEVNKVVDAKEAVIVTVKKQDSASGRKKSPKSCALARACVRTKVADGAIINIGNSYLIKGDVATRYKTSIGVGREITSFDRHHDFASGSGYRLSPISPRNRLGVKQRSHGKSGPPGHKNKVKVHRTVRVRVAGN